jgi:ATP-dependent Clp protease protease subunit
MSESTTTAAWPPEVPAPKEPPGAPPTVPGPVPTGPSADDRSSLADEVAQRLLERRMVRVVGRLDAAAADDAAARLLLLDRRGSEPIDLTLSCPDGDVVAAMALADTIETLGAEVRTTCSGQVGGAALVAYAVADRRLAQPHATFHLTEPTEEAEGRATDIARRAAYHAEVAESMCRRLAAVTGRPADTVAADLRSNRYLTAAEAQDYGLVDEVVSARPRPRRAV